MMKRLSILVFVAAVATGGVFAQVTGSSHDLSGLTGASASGEICNFCHTPHNPTQAVPLWNREASIATSYSRYTSTTMDSPDFNTAWDPRTGAGANNVSAFCLSCHDDTIALGDGTSLGNAGGHGVSNTLSQEFPATVADMGTDLSNDHPVHLTYPTVGQDPDFNTPPLNGIILYGAGDDQVECASCHDPHLTTNGNFLAISNDGSALCKSCHTK